MNFHLYSLNSPVVAIIFFYPVHNSFSLSLIFTFMHSHGGPLLLQYAYLVLHFYFLIFGSSIIFRFSLAFHDTKVSTNPFCISPFHYGVEWYRKEIMSKNVRKQMSFKFEEENGSNDSMICNAKKCIYKSIKGLRQKTSDFLYLQLIII